MDNQLTKEEVVQIIEADDLHIAPLRADGVTYGTPTWIWAVPVDDTIYVRAYNGKHSRWYQSAISQQAGKIVAAGMNKKVKFEPVTGEINQRIDEAYRQKYTGSPYLIAMISKRAQEATVRISPGD